MFMYLGKDPLMCNSSRRTAFTLIEVLVVVAIIALLIAILLPSLTKARDQARSAMCKANVKQIMLGTLMYVHDQKTLPGSQTVYYRNGLWPIARPTDLKRPLPVWDGAVQSYAGSGGKDSQLFKEDCPQRGSIFRYTRERQIYVCPSERMGQPSDTPEGGDGNGRNSYSMNAYIAHKAPDKLYRPTRPGGWPVEGKDRNGQPVPTPQHNSLRWTDSQMFVLVEEHPYRNKNVNCEGNFNVTDEIVARHSIIKRPRMSGATIIDPGLGRTNIGYLDGRSDSVLMPVRTMASDLFAQIGFPVRQGSECLEFLPVFLAKFK